MSKKVWLVDKTHAEAGFAISHLGIVEMSGFFKDFDIKVESQQEDFSDAIIEATINVRSIDTRNQDRDHHLMSEVFFNADQFANAFINGKKMTNNGNGNYIMEADVTIKGITKTLFLDLFYHGSVENPMTQKITAGFSLAANINRKDFEIGLEVSDFMLSELVSLQFNGEFVGQ